MTSNTILTQLLHTSNTSTLICLRKHPTQEWPEGVYG